MSKYRPEVTELIAEGFDPGEAKTIAAIDYLTLLDLPKDMMTFMKENLERLPTLTEAQGYTLDALTCIIDNETED